VTPCGNARPRGSSPSRRDRPCGPSASRCGSGRATSKPPRPTTQRLPLGSGQPSGKPRTDVEVSLASSGSDVSVRSVLDPVLKVHFPVADVVELASNAATIVEMRPFTGQVVPGHVGDEQRATVILKSWERDVAVIKVESDVGEGVGGGHLIGPSVSFWMTVNDDGGDVAGRCYFVVIGAAREGELWDVAGIAVPLSCAKFRFVASLASTVLEAVDVGDWVVGVHGVTLNAAVYVVNPQSATWEACRGKQG